ncbi:MAG: hypothetical protein ACTSVY_11585 [Candidatus Helarchaeota archaeon]
MGNKIKAECTVCKKKIDKKKRFCSRECENAFINNLNRLTRIVKKLYDKGFSIEEISDRFNIYYHEVKRLIKRATSVLNPEMIAINLPENSDKNIISFSKFEKLTSKKYIKPAKIYVDGEEF